ncbi:MAG: sigma-E factor negative regulatory protein [Proteobacteria bacterium]|nr:sigma-E factor negative regulatory protein [Pseudomonadota bacterium]
MKHDFIDENAREQLSALLDGELDNDDSARFLQRRLQHDDALVGQLVRWQLAGDILRANARSGGGDDLANRVRAAIEREQAQVATKPKARRGWMLWGSGLAAAAALGFAALNLPGTADPVSIPVKNEVATVSNAPVVAVPATAAAITASVKIPAKQAPAATGVSEPVQHRVADVAPRHRQRDTVADVSSRVHDASQEEAPPAAPERVIAVATAAPAKSRVNRNPFTMRAAAPQSELAWPKAVLPGFNSGLNADFRNDGNAGNPFAPHRAYEEPLPDR